MKFNCYLDIEIKDRIINCEVIGNYIPGDQGDWMTPPSPPDIDIDRIIIKSIKLFDGEFISVTWLVEHNLYNLVQDIVFDKLNWSNDCWYKLCNAVEDSLND
jgi:hypothetical protein